MSSASSHIKVGCCGFSMAQAEYFRTFPCVEINSSFYNLPKIETAAKWRAMAPKGFEFSMKAWQAITHRAGSPTYRRTRIEPGDAKFCGHFAWNRVVRRAWEQTREVAAAMEAFLVLFQCPASFRPTRENVANLKRFFEKATRGKLLLGWEPRGDWEPGLVALLCKELDLVHVVDPFVGPASVKGAIVYFRLHGGKDYSHQFSDAELRQLKKWCMNKVPTYCFFNNVTMADDAKRFMRVVAR